MFDPFYSLDGLLPASYNPRTLTDASARELEASLTTLGAIKPIIVNRPQGQATGGTIVAGHQRTARMQALGWKGVPAFVLPLSSVTDEIRFNQLHNSADIEKGEEVVSLRFPAPAGGWSWQGPGDIEVETLRVKNAQRRQEMLALIARYGQWGSCIASETGEVLVSGLYAMACKILGQPCLTYTVAANQSEDVRRYFGQPYGSFSYDHLPHSTWAQSLVQLSRLRSKAGTSGKSRTYENLVLPRLASGMRVLDFGAGQMDYVQRLKSRGVDIRGLEFYFRDGMNIAVSKVHRDIDFLCDDIQDRGRYDLVVCDSVLNSVDSVQAEEDVLMTLRALCKPHGTIIFSGRSMDMALYEESQTTGTNDRRRRLNFFDANGLTAMYAQGVWRYQKFHTLPQIVSLAENHFGSPYEIYNGDGRQLTKGKINTQGWGVVAVNEKSVTFEEAMPSLSREFDLPLPGGMSYERSTDILDALSPWLLGDS